MGEELNVIYGVYFICCINNYLDVVKEQLAMLRMGLLQRTQKVIVFVTRYNHDECSELDDILNSYDKFIIIKTPDNSYERYAINNYKKHIAEKNYYLYYFHTKGLKRKDDPLINVFTSRRQILNYYTLLQYNLNIQLLEEYDAVGCSIHLYPKKHFSGNFWWSKSSYLHVLEDINDKYLSPEMYVLSGNNCNYISLAQDTNNIQVDKYKFPTESVIKGNLTSKCIVIEDHKKLITMCE